jgi:ribosome maturation factor RimP
VGVVPTLLFAILDEEEVVMGPAETIRDLVEPLLTAKGLECWDVVAASGVVRVLVDRPGGVDLDTLGAVTEVVSAALDEHDVVPGGRYELEVSSPGVERTLRTPSQYRRFAGTQVSVKTVAAVDGQRRFQGVLVAADDDGITIDPEEGQQTSLRIAYTNIERAHTVLVWGPTPKPGQPGRGGRGVPSRSRRTASAPIKDTAS